MIIKNWIKPAFIIICLIGLITGLPFIIHRFKYDPSTYMRFAWFIGGLFALGAIPISIWTILEHLINYTKPYLQRHIIRILWMVPIYATNAWSALLFPKTAIYFDTLRECYEAYVIYNFLAFLLNYLRRQYPELNEHINEKEPIKHLYPLCCLKPWSMGSEFIEHCRHGVLQYTVVRPITTIIALICEVCGVYGETNFSYKYAYIYLTVVNNISQVWALYCLVMFYRCTKDELKPINPMAKFLCVKFVVFMSFWQSVLISILDASGVIETVATEKFDGGQSIGITLQNFAICIEMFFASIAHHFAFRVTPFSDPNAPRIPCCYSWWSMLDVSDVKRDVVQHVLHVGSSVGFIGFNGNVSDLRTSIVPGLSRSRELHVQLSNTDDDASYLIPHLPAEQRTHHASQKRQNALHLQTHSPGVSSDSGDNYSYSDNAEKMSLLPSV